MRVRYELLLENKFDWSETFDTQDNQFEWKCMTITLFPTSTKYFPLSQACNFVTHFYLCAGINWTKDRDVFDNPKLC